MIGPFDGTAAGTGRRLTWCALFALLERPVRPVRIGIPQGGVSWDTQSPLAGGSDRLLAAPPVLSVRRETGRTRKSSRNMYDDSTLSDFEPSWSGRLTPGVRFAQSMWWCAGCRHMLC
jgi:hypothetical protein